MLNSAHTAASNGRRRCSDRLEVRGGEMEPALRRWGKKVTMGIKMREMVKGGKRRLLQFPPGAALQLRTPSISLTVLPASIQGAEQPLAQQGPRRRHKFLTGHLPMSECRTGPAGSTYLHENNSCRRRYRPTFITFKFSPRITGQNH